MNFSSSLQLAVLAVLALALSPKSYGSPIGWGKCDMEIEAIIHRYMYTLLYNWCDKWQGG